MLTSTPGFSGKPRRYSAMFVMSSKLVLAVASGEQAMWKQQVAGTGFLRYCIQFSLSQLCALNHFSEGNYCYWRDNLSLIAIEKSETMDGVLQGISKNFSATGLLLLCCKTLSKFPIPANLK